MQETQETQFDPGSGRSLGGGNGNVLQYSCLENPMDKGASWARVHGVAKSRTRLSDSACAHTHNQLLGFCFQNLKGQLLERNTAMFSVIV